MIYSHDVLAESADADTRGVKKFSVIGHDVTDMSEKPWPTELPKTLILFALDLDKAGDLAKDMAKMLWGNLPAIEEVARKGEIALNKDLAPGMVGQSHASRTMVLKETFKFPEAWKVKEVERVWVRLQQMGNPIVRLFLRMTEAST